MGTAAGAEYPSQEADADLGGTRPAGRDARHLPAGLVRVPRHDGQLGFRHRPVTPPRPALGAVGAVVSVGALAAGYRAGFGPRSQLFGPFPYRRATAEKVVALTFDDGPNEPWTSQLLDAPPGREVPPPFFQVGRCPQPHPEITRRVLAEGHVLGNHSLSHAFHRYATEPRQQEEI